MFSITKYKGLEQADSARQMTNPNPLAMTILCDPFMFKKNIRSWKGIDR